MRVLPILLTTLLAMVGCLDGRSGSGAPPDVALAYADPADSGWRWRQNQDLSTPTKLVLELWGPDPAVMGRGVVFTLQADAAALDWAPGREGGGLAENLALLPRDGQLLTRHQRTGGSLTATILQLGRGNAVPMDRAVCRVALQAKAGLRPGAAPVLTAPRLQVFPSTGADLVTVPCAVGTVTVGAAAR
jgi:hypothetical protein